jgi:glutamine amidotransferase
MFMLALSFGMQGDVKAGISRMAGLVEQVAKKHGVENALQMTLGISDGESLYAVRYSTEGNSRSLFHSATRDATAKIAPDAGRFSRGARAIVSEPLSTGNNSGATANARSRRSASYSPIRPLWTNNHF